MPQQRHLKHARAHQVHLPRHRQHTATSTHGAADLQSGNHGPFLHLRATVNRPSNRVLTSTPTNPTTTALTAPSQHRYRPMTHDTTRPDDTRRVGGRAVPREES